jgi:hypothetical protein
MRTREQKRRDVAAGEKWELRFMMALKKYGLEPVKVPVKDCKREGDVHLTVRGTDFAFEIQVAKPENERYSWTGSKLTEFSPSNGRRGFAILGCPGRSAFCAVEIETLRHLLDLARCNDFAGIRYNAEYDYFIMDPEIMEDHALVSGLTIEDISRFFTPAAAEPPRPTHCETTRAHEPGALICEHANECPMKCPCDPSCYCRTLMCMETR